METRISSYICTTISRMDNDNFFKGGGVRTSFDMTKFRSVLHSTDVIVVSSLVFMFYTCDKCDNIHKILGEDERHRENTESITTVLCIVNTYYCVCVGVVLKPLPVKVQRYDLCPAMAV